MLVRTNVGYYVRNISGANVQARHKHQGGRVFSKIYYGRRERYFETWYKGKDYFTK
jgi:hypothetical protein